MEKVVSKKCTKLGGTAKTIRRVMLIQGNEGVIEKNAEFLDCQDKDQCGIKDETGTYNWKICPLAQRR